VASEVRDHADRRVVLLVDLGVVVTVRAKALVSGVVIVLAYLSGAIASGHLDPFARHPLLDGVIYNHPYNWVSPPAALASTNKQPESGSYTLSLAGKSQPGVFQTNDGQAVLILPQGAIPPSAGAKSVGLTLTPLDPAKFGGPPSGLAVAGNVYQIKGVYQPGGKPVTRLVGGQSEAALIYPVTNTTHHVLLQSQDGKTWKLLPSSDTLASHQVLATKVTKLGYFSVGVPSSGASPAANPSSSGGIGGALTAVIAVLAVVVLLLAFRAEYVRRRKARGGRSARGNGPRHRR
jgi:hypothetical protein